MLDAISVFIDHHFAIFSCVVGSVYLLGVIAATAWIAVGNAADARAGRGGVADPEGVALLIVLWPLMAAIFCIAFVILRRTRRAGRARGFEPMTPRTIRHPGLIARAG